jgi:Flp pilus assembly pilin Flp
MIRRVPPPWRHCERGATMVEFALVAPVLILMIMGVFDLAHQYYATAVLQGAMQKAARDSTLETGSDRAAALDAYVSRNVRTITGANSVFTPQRLNYANFSDVGDPENFTDAPPLNAKYDLGECYEDLNGNGKWDSDLGKAGQGGAQDAVLYRMTVTYPRLFPLSSLIGLSENQTIVANTVLRNQPFGDQAVRTVVSCPVA